MKPRILIVDDDIDVRTLLREALSGDYEIIEATDGIFGLAEVMVGEQHIDLIVTDLKMPEVNGIEFIENLPEGIPTIVISAYLQSEEFQEALGRLHPAAVLEKPFQISALREAVQQVLGK